MRGLFLPWPTIEQCADSQTRRARDIDQLSKLFLICFPFLRITCIARQRKQASLPRDPSPGLKVPTPRALTIMSPFESLNGRAEIIRNVSDSPGYLFHPLR